MFEVFTDGACIGNPGPGGWAYILRNRALGLEIIKAGGEPATTNNRMELSAVIFAFEEFNASSSSLAGAFVVYSDSKYVVDAFRQGWIDNWTRRGWKTADKKPVKNKDLWERLIAATAPHEVSWEWVKGHAGHPENEAVDRLAQEAAVLHSRS